MIRVFVSLDRSHGGVQQPNSAKSVGGWAERRPYVFPATALGPSAKPNKLVMNSCSADTCARIWFGVISCTAAMHTAK
jgi:hypothetical protein